MPFDGIVSNAITRELNQKLTGGKIRKIQQPEKDEIRLIVNKGKENLSLLLSASPNNARIHLSNIKKESPLTPPVFCMTLRKHISGSVIKRIEQQNEDRIVEIVLDSRNEFGEPQEKRLIMEVTGRNSNLILTAEENGEKKILDAVKRVGLSSSRYRHILPGEVYKAPPGEGRIEVGKTHKTDILKLMKEDQSLSPEKFFTTRFFGISPAIVREALYRSKIEGNTKLFTYSDEQMEQLADTFKDLTEEMRSSDSFFVFEDSGNLIDFYPGNLTYLGSRYETFSSVSEALEYFYTARDLRMRFKSKSADLRHKLENLRKRAAKKLQTFNQDLKRLENNDKNRKYGDLITANIYQIQKGMKEAFLIDYEDPEFTQIRVPLKVNETPSQNAQRFYKKYQKGKRAKIELEHQKKITEEQLYYIETLIEGLNHSQTPNELEEILHEYRNSDLASGKEKRSKKGNKKPKASEPMCFTSSEGFKIYVGKNNYQNDYISTRLGVAEDCWLHVKDAPGSHVLIVANGRFIPEKTVLEGGMLAAWYSSQKNSENVPVDYLEFKDLKKPKGANPGMVIFTTHDTMYITPNKAEVARIEGLAEPL